MTDAEWGRSSYGDAHSKKVLIRCGDGTSRERRGEEERDEAEQVLQLI